MRRERQTRVEAVCGEMKARRRQARRKRGKERDGEPSGEDGQGEALDSGGQSGESQGEDEGPVSTSSTRVCQSKEGEMITVVASREADRCLSALPSPVRHVPGPVETLVVLGNAKFLAGAFREAATLYRRALLMAGASRQGTNHVDFMSCLLNGGEACLRVEGEAERAQEYFAQAMEKVGGPSNTCPPAPWGVACSTSVRHASGLYQARTHARTRACITGTLLSFQFGADQAATLAGQQANSIHSCFARSRCFILFGCSPC